MRILLIGGSGSLGSNLLVLNPGHDLYPAYQTHEIRHPLALHLDITERDRVCEVMEALRPHVVIHAGGMTKPAACERDPETTWRVNVQGTTHLVDAATQIGARFILLSTDLVFDHSTQPRQEESQPRPISVYGQSKVAAEREVMQRSRDFAIVRISLLYGWSARYSSSFAEWVLDELRAGRPCPLFADQWRNMTYIPDLAAALFELAERREPLNGILHIAGPALCSRYDLGRELATTFSLPLELAQKAAMRGQPLAGYTPECVALDTTRMKQVLHTHIRAMPDGVRAMKALEEQGYRARFDPHF